MKKIETTRRTPILTATFAVVLTVFVSAAIADTLDIYFIDVEGGQSTLVVMPDGETLLIDAGFPGDGGSDYKSGDASKARDAQRIVAAAADAGVSRIDYLLITHFHADHFGGVAELSQLLPIGTFIDHDTAAADAPQSPATLALFDAYREVRANGAHIVPAAGDRLPLKSIDATVLSTEGSTIALPLAEAGANNANCDRPVFPAGEPFENPRSTGVVIDYGEFRFLDLGDLSGQPLSDLVCPADLVGRVDVYLVAHHGGADVADPATFAAFRPRIAILNNGAMKGGAAAIFDLLRESREIDDVWQLHRSETEGAGNFADERIANLDEQTAHWIKLSANSDGSFRILNGRTGEWTDYDNK
jgi:beta-lactamase superfamily II metal-dependent hydrolase